MKGLWGEAYFGASGVEGCKIFSTLQEVKGKHIFAFFIIRFLKIAKNFIISPTRYQLSKRGG